MSSAVGLLPLSLHYGYDLLERFLAGCRSMDEHFLSAPPRQNIPVRRATTPNNPPPHAALLV